MDLYHLYHNYIPYPYDSFIQELWQYACVYKFVTVSLEKVLSKGYLAINRCSTFCEILCGLLPKELSGCIVPPGINCHI